MLSLLEASIRINVASQSCRITLFALSQSKFRFENTFDTSLSEAYVGKSCDKAPKEAASCETTLFIIYTS